MAFLVSPGVQVVEKDLTNIIPAVSSSIGGFAGLFEWGPCEQATTVSSEADLIAQFGYPRISPNAGSNNRLDWYSAANFLGYSNNLSVVRVLTDGARNASSETDSVVSDTISIIIIGNTSVPNVAINVPYDGTNTVAITPTSTDSDGSVAEKLVTALGVAGVSATADGQVVSYEKGSFTTPSNTTLNSILFAYAESSMTNEDDSDVAINTASIKNYEDFLSEYETLVNGSVYARFPGKLGNSIGVVLLDSGMTDSDFENKVLFGTTRAQDIFDEKPGTSVWAETNHNTSMNDEVHVIVYTTDTFITGNANEILETYAFLSKAKNGKTSDSGPNYYVDVVNQGSKWVYLLNEETAATSAVNQVSGNHTIGSTLRTKSDAAFNAFFTNANIDGVRMYELSAGKDGATVTDANYITAYNYLADVETVDVNLLITGSRSKTVQKHVITIGEIRKDAITFVSPSYNAAVVNPSAAKVVNYFNNSSDGFNSTSYAVFDSGWKRQYDRHNDEYFWIPLNADIAGVNARTDLTNDAWWSPAGLNRGFIQNVVKLSFNPNQTDRDTLYPKRVNPVVTLRGQGTLLYGDKTALSRPSAFDRINVRRLFIVLEKAIATASKYQLFEFNDDFTRRSFVNAVEPFLADVKTRRGLYDYKVICDESNNTGEVIDNNRFVADIYLKPARSINYITLNFVAVRTGVSFNEVVGA